ncbi:hypothetical protein [Desulfolutivibrio sulfoxidireducens]|uniref:hypothetical protein n=1 Tax=Desulfolutivibrio sulfoxidireducens TaxID=2773299 RepID=UPI00159E185E|nr:hypothetical protein [Desulfolutivibrio sulfoxidireducens]QLA15786.1 hypothetical protein GD605_06310 [Desulfolutivibrio sulfoxidireducens]QLA19391.1 hypothetical protein GD604_06335 [Desulfolutivibrio sulfoxidireducens]
MVLSEREAKFKYCPLLTTHDGKLRFCQGTMCMMWRCAVSGQGADSDKGFCGLAGRPVLPGESVDNRPSGLQ